ncbi:MAG TPA: J domain-containing protein, partial [Rubrivivax sp.]|nr:J domain-containing protein [Rubrivivax sp.]
MAASMLVVERGIVKRESRPTMTKPTRTQLDIAAAAARPASPEHKRFQTLLGKIDKARQRLQAWQQQLPLFAQAHAARVAPLEAELKAARRAWAFELEALQGAQRWSRADAATLSEMICDICGALLDADGDGDGEPDAELKALYNRHAEVDFDTEDQLHLNSMKAMLETMGGVDLGDEPVESAEELMRRARARMADQAQPPEEPPAGKQRKAPRQTAAQKRAEEDAKRISQTVREVYRKLASALHPDRVDAAVPAAERASRTSLMQRANTAYEAGDLLALLELQLQIEQVDLAHAANVATEQVRHFNKVLAEQLRELEAEIDERQLAFCASYGLMAERRLDPTRLELLLKDELRELAYAQAQLQRNRRLFKGETAQVKRQLKQWRAEQRAADFDDLFF